MRYVLPAGLLTSLHFLRGDYQTERKVNLDETPSLIGVPTFFGGTDVVARDSQTKFIEKMLVVLSANLMKEEEICTAEQWQANLTASRVIIAACLFVQSQISSPKSNSALYRLIDKSLGINSENYLDDEDKEICFLAANRIINSSISALDDANIALRKAHMKPISEAEWNKFSMFLSNASIKKVSVNPYTNYPITSITQPMFGAAFSYTGATIGFLSGDMISNSTRLMSTKFQATALIGSTLLMLGPAGPMGVALFSQVIAGKLISGLCSVSMAHVLGTVMGIAGQGVGMAIGLPMDWVYRMVWKTVALIAAYGHYENTSTGIRIADGKTMMNGIVIEVTPLDQLPEGYEQKSIELKEDGKIYMDGKEVEVPETGLQLPPEVLAELKAQFELMKKEAAPEETAPLVPTL
ncbi:hypothetical protein [Legionella shakespearei]|uniref:Substrate of the Dot/Icm secretion system n=2 Tax=Legionella shakespearei TaxID=45075 RepID=A0A0W0YLV3_9GAMM|nr:hypothetical protein [Legionella shakespearei]KTD57897.1 substrate of the Dot/Icm secretion system [Legionella shakespearei DSM 23087]